MKIKTKHIALIIIAAGLLLRIYQVAAAPLWYDEAFTAWLSDLTVPRMIQATAGDTHPPGYYFFTWIIVHLFGKSELLLRLPSVLFSGAGLVLFWFILDHEKLSDLVKLLALGLMAVMPFQIHFAQEARQYALLQFLVLLAYFFIQRRLYAWYGVTLAVMLYVHNYAVFYGPALFLLAYAKELNQPRYIPENYHPGYKIFDYTKADESRCTRVLIYTALAGAAFIPWLLVLFGQMAIVKTGYWIPPVTAGSVIYVMYMWFLGFALAQAWQPIAVIITIGLIMAGLSQAKKLKAAFIMGYLPMILAVVVSLVWQPVFLFRGLIGSAPFIYLLLASWYGSIKLKWRIYSAAMVLPVLIAGVVSFYAFNIGQKTGDTKDILEAVQAVYQPGDLILHANDGSILGMKYYAAEMDQAELLECPEHNLGALSTQTRAAMGINIVSDLSAYDRVIFVGSIGPTITGCNYEKALTIMQQSQAVYESKSDYTLTGVYLWPKTLSDNQNAKSKTSQ